MAKDNTVYVTMTDKTMSGWGKAKGKLNKLVFICKDMSEAFTVEANALNRDDMKNVNVCAKLPRYSERTHYTQIKTIKDYPSWYKPGYF